MGLSGLTEFLIQTVLALIILHLLIRLPILSFIAAIKEKHSRRNQDLLRIFWEKAYYLAFTVLLVVTSMFFAIMIYQQENALHYFVLALLAILAFFLFFILWIGQASKNDFALHEKVKEIDFKLNSLLNKTKKK